MNMPSVDIIIPSLNSPVIDRVIDAIIRQEAFHHVLRVFVIGKDDAGLLPDYPNVQLVDTKFLCRQARHAIWVLHTVRPNGSFSSIQTVSRSPIG